MTIVDIVAIVAAGVVFVAWRVYRLFNLMWEIEQDIGDKLNEVINQCNENTRKLNAINKELEHKQTRVRKNGGTKAQG